MPALSISGILSPTHPAPTPLLQQWSQQPPTKSVLQAIADGNTGELSTLLRKPLGFDVNAKNAQGANVVLMAAIDSAVLNLEVVKMLVHAGAVDNGGQVKLAARRKSLDPAVHYAVVALLD